MPSRSWFVQIVLSEKLSYADVVAFFKADSTIAYCATNAFNVYFMAYIQYAAKIDLNVLISMLKDQKCDDALIMLGLPSFHDFLFDSSMSYTAEVWGVREVIVDEEPQKLYQALCCDPNRSHADISNTLFNTLAASQYLELFKEFSYSIICERIMRRRHNMYFVQGFGPQWAESIQEALYDNDGPKTMTVVIIQLPKHETEEYCELKMHYLRQLRMVKGRMRPQKVFFALSKIGPVYNEAANHKLQHPNDKVLAFTNKIPMGNEYKGIKVVPIALVPPLLEDSLYNLSLND